MNQNPEENLTPDELHLYRDTSFRVREGLELDLSPEHVMGLLVTIAELRNAMRRNIGCGQRVTMSLVHPAPLDADELRALGILKD